VDGKEYTLGLWDTAGKLEVDKTHHEKVRKDIIIFVL
jgi:hypothetical protein